MTEITRMSDDRLESYMNWNPFLQVGIFAEGCTWISGDRPSFYLQTADWHVWTTLGFVVQGCCLYSAIGLGFALRAMHLFRRRVF